MMEHYHDYDLVRIVDILLIVSSLIMSGWILIGEWSADEEVDRKSRDSQSSD